ncbi:MAG: DUF4468 domain-containing protein [Bacteroidales bacterium]
MKINIVLSLLLLFVGSASFTASSQSDTTILPLDKDGEKILYQGVVEAEGSANELFYRAVTWMNDYWVNARGVIKKQDRPNGILIAQPRFDIKKETEEGNMQRAGRMIYVLKLEFKDGRYRYTVSDLNLKGTSPFPLENWIDPGSEYYDQRDQAVLHIIDDEIRSMIDHMHEGMTKEEEKSNDDW